LTIRNQIQLGRYVDKNSTVHRLDPRIKFALLLIYAFAIVCDNSAMHHFLATIPIILFTIASKIEISKLLRVFSGVSVFALFILTLHSFLTPGDSLWEWGILSISRSGIERGIAFSLRMFLMIGAASIFGWTTRPVDFANSIEIGLAPLRKLGIRVRDLSTIVMISMRFIPDVIRDADRILKAQKARGLSIGNGPIAKARSLAPLVVPLFVDSFRKADSIALSLHLTGYDNDSERTFIENYRIRMNDIMIITISFAMLFAYMFYQMLAP
jgi:energy-coupling factor transport system permease protein